MENKNERIISLLNEGKSYSEIQHQLQVSPSKIAQVKKGLQISNQDLIDDGSSDSSSAIKSKERSVQNTEIKQDTISPYDHSSTTDPGLILELRKLELAHEERMQKMKMDEKERERFFESKKLTASQSSNKMELTLLKEKIQQLEEEVKLKSEAVSHSLFESKLGLHDHTDKIEDDMEWKDEYHEENIKEGIEMELSDEFIASFSEFVKNFLTWDGEYIDLNDIEEGHNSIESLKGHIEDQCAETDIDPEEFDEWDVLSEAQNDLQNFKDEIEGSFFKTQIHYKFDLEWRERLEDYIENSEFTMHQPD